jgi:threonyl-tRNA synthetase
LPNGITFSVDAFNIYLTLVVGQVEKDGNSVNVRIRDDVSTRNQGVPIPRDEFIRQAINLKKERSLDDSLGKSRESQPVANGT